MELGYKLSIGIFEVASSLGAWLQAGKKISKLSLSIGIFEVASSLGAWLQAGKKISRTRRVTTTTWMALAYLKSDNRHQAIVSETQNVGCDVKSQKSINRFYLRGMTITKQPE